MQNKWTSVIFHCRHKCPVFVSSEYIIFPLLSRIVQECRKKQEVWWAWLWQTCLQCFEYMSYAWKITLCLPHTKQTIYLTVKCRSWPQPFLTPTFIGETNGWCRNSPLSLGDIKGFQGHFVSGHVISLHIIWYPRKMSLGQSDQSKALFLMTSKPVLGYLPNYVTADTCILTCNVDIES